MYAFKSHVEKAQVDGSSSLTFVRLCLVRVLFLGGFGETHVPITSQKFGENISYQF